MAASKAVQTTALVDSGSSTCRLADSTTDNYVEGCDSALIRVRGLTRRSTRSSGCGVQQHDLGCIEGHARDCACCRDDENKLGIDGMQIRHSLVERDQQ